MKKNKHQHDHDVKLTDEEIEAKLDDLRNAIAQQDTSVAKELEKTNTYQQLEVGYFIILIILKFSFLNVNYLIVCDFKK